MKVKIRRDIYGDGIGIVFYYKQNGKAYSATPVSLDFKEVDEGADIDPTIRLGSEIARDFLDAMANELDRHGVKTENDFKVQGLLEAKEKHLQDMRKLVFKRR